MKKFIPKNFKKPETRLLIISVLAMLLFAPTSMQAKVIIENNSNYGNVVLSIDSDTLWKKWAVIKPEGTNSSQIDKINTALFEKVTVGCHIEDTQHNNHLSRNDTRGGVYVGDPASTGYSANIPAAFYNQHSLNQTIYQQGAINHYGEITEIIYPLVDAMRCSPHTVQIWMAQTPKTSFTNTDDWIPFENFTLVYTNENGYDFSGYLQDVYISLDAHFNYTEGNLVIMTNKVGSNWDVSPYVKWLFTTSSVAMNTIHALRQPPDGGFDPASGYPSTSTGEYVINNSTAPNVILQFKGDLNYNMDLRRFKGPLFAEFKKQINYSIDIKNIGNMSTSEYTVKLMHNTTELTSVPGVLVQPNQTITVNIPYSFNNAGTFDVHVEVDFPANEAPEELISSLITTKVYPPGYSLFYVGAYPSNSFANCPVHDAMNKSSVSQVIYREELLGDLNGEITEMIFFYLRSSGENPQNCNGKLYLSPSSRDEVGIQYSWADRDKFFEPLEQFELSFDDVIPWCVPFGSSIPITYQLTEPYSYTGGNLTLMPYVPWFNETPVTGIDFSSIWEHTDVDYWSWGFTAHNESPLLLDDYVALFDQAGICFWGKTVPNVIFVTYSEYTYTYTVEFIVKDEEDNIIDDAKILFNGELIDNYVITDIESGTYSYSVSKEGYETVHGQVIINDEDVTETVVLKKEIGISDKALTGVTLYPNPFTNEIHISSDFLVKSIEIKNVIGQSVSDFFYNGKSIETKNLSNGVYFIVIEGYNNERVVYKMVK